MNNFFLNEFLHFGYLPIHKNRYPFEIEKIQISEIQGDENELKEKAFQCFKNVIKKKLTSKRVLIPLSGGVDSRLILAEIFNQIEREKIRTITFGVPGNLDVELAAKVTSIFDINHQFIDLRSVSFTENELVEFAGKSGTPSNLMEAFWSHSMWKEMEADETVFSGFIGDRITGSVPEHLRKIESFDEAKTVFIDQNRADKSGFLPQMNPEELHVSDDLYSFLSPYEKLDYRIRQMNMTAPIVLGSFSDIQKPLIDSDFVSFFYSIDSAYRNHQSLFFTMARTYYPDFFDIGVKNNFGAPVGSSTFRQKLMRKFMVGRRLINRNSPKLGIQDQLQNYTDPYWFFVKNKATSVLTEKTIEDLSKRSLLSVNPMIALEKVQKGDMGFAKALEILFNLEIYIKAGVIK
ncbi:MAG: asparagine synthase-related protein [Balneolaceae bacterium]